MDARYGAHRGARFFRQKLTPQIFFRVFGDRSAGIPALLRAIVHQSVLTDINVAGSGAASPLTAFPSDDSILKTGKVREIALA